MTKKRHLLICLLFFIAVFTVYAFTLPQTVRQMEATDFFTWDKAFFFGKLSEAPGLTAWLTNYLLQFFRWTFAGMAIMGAALTLTGWFCGRIPAALGRPGWSELGLLLPIVLMLITPFNLQVYLEALFLMMAFVAGLKLRNTYFRAAYLVVMAFAGFFLMSTTLLALLLVGLMVVELLRKRSLVVIAAGVAAIVIATLMPRFSAHFIGILPSGYHFLNAPVRIPSVWAYVIAIVVPVLLVLIPWRPKRGMLRFVPAAVAIIAVAGGIYYGASNTDIRFTEKCYHLLDLANQKDWNRLLNEIPHEETSTSKLASCYALLAESALGTLPDHLFSYAITNPEDFLYRHETTRPSFLFNRLFYDNLDNYDEAFRMAFEYGVMTPEGVCFSSLRQMTHYAILNGDAAVARKYLAILSRSSTHGRWIKAERELLSRQPAPKEKPVIRDTYINVYPINSEMIRQVEYDPTNKKAFDYVLLGLLMQKDLPRFSIILNGFDIYKDRTKPLPRAYAEAAAMLALDPESNVRQTFSYPEQYDAELRKFLSLYDKTKAPADFAAYRGSYWYYFFFAQQQNNAQQQQSLRAVN